jgi:hypothetical protein
MPMDSSFVVTLLILLSTHPWRQLTIRAENAKTAALCHFSPLTLSMLLFPHDLILSHCRPTPYHIFPCDVIILTSFPTACPTLYFSCSLPWEPFSHPTSPWLLLTPFDTLSYITLGNVPTLQLSDLTLLCDLHVILLCMIHP